MSYKDYFSIPKNSDFQLKDVSYSKTSVLEEGLDKSEYENNTKLVSFERVKPELILAVLDLLTIKLTLHRLQIKNLSEKEQE